MSLPSAKFATIFDTLPDDVQNRIIDKQLIPLLDLVSKGKQKDILASAVKMQRRHRGIPELDIKAKQREISGLLDEHNRDAKRSFVKGRSNRTEILEHIVESATCWLNDIWRVVYEHNVDFMLAHNCLLFVVSTLDQIGHARASCRCALTSMYVPITIKGKSGEVIKTWQVNGAHNVEEVLQFIWRDLFLSILATGTQRQIKRIPDMLDDIEELLGWTGLERLLYGGKKCPYHMDEEEEEEAANWETDEDENEDEDAYTDDDSVLDMPIEQNGRGSEPKRKVSPSHARHWSHRISNQMWQFRKHVHTAMTAVFKVNPSLRLYSALLASSSDPETTEAELMGYLNSIATTCPEVLAAALDIYALENNAAKIATLLSTHAHLLRPRDAPVYQSAVTVLASDPVHQQRAFEIIEKELLETGTAVHTALLGSFSMLDEPENQVEVEQIMKLRPSAQGRQDRIEHWVDSISTPGTNNPHPMALAAMVIGLPIVPALDGMEDADPLGYFDIDPSDPDMEDLRDEFRPRLKQRFEGWTATAAAVKGGATVLTKVFKELMKTMPYLRTSDIVEEMLGRLVDKPSKQYLVDAVYALSAFVKVQRRKLASTKKEKTPRASTQAFASAGPSGLGAHAPPTSTAAPPSSDERSPPPPSMQAVEPAPTAGPSTFSPWAFSSTFGGSSTSTPDARAETPPPPLEPITPAPAPLYTFYSGLPQAATTGGGAGSGGFGEFGSGGFGGMEDVD